MEPEVDAASLKPKPKSLDQEDPPASLQIPETLVEKTEESNLDPSDVDLHTPAVLDPLVNRSELLECPHGRMDLPQLHLEFGRIHKSDANQESDDEEEEEESRSESENDIVCEQADELIIRFSAVSIGDAAAAAGGFESPIAMSDCVIAKVCPSTPIKPEMERRFKNLVNSAICKKLQF